MYKFRTTASTSVGTGVYTEYIYVRTMESIPTASPNVVFIDKSYKVITLQLRPPDDLDDVNGVIVSYTVKYRGINIDTYVNTKVIDVNSVDFLTPIKVHLTDLEEGVEYNIQARISTFVGGGPYSSVVTVTTI